MARLWRQFFLVSILSVVVLGVLAPPLAAKTAEPTLAARAWYWEEAQSSEQTLPDGSKVTIDTPNPFCPNIPGNLGEVPGACAEGRLPIEIQNGDYETPNKISAVNFDLSLVPIGSKVSKFTVSFLEAKAGCYDQDEDGKPNCEETDPINVQDKELKACEIDAFFGEGDARPYKEAPKYTCTDTDPIAKRKEVKGKDGEVDHVWTFDLTAFAQSWIKEFTTNTSIMLVGNPPKGYKPGDTDQEDNWRTVLTGPKAPGGKEGVKAEIEFIPGEIELPPTEPTTTGTVGTTGTTGTISTGSTGDISTGSTSDFGSSGSIGGSSGGAAPPTDPAAEGEAPIAAAGAEQTPEGMPGYVWLALIAGLMAWSFFRSAVLENAKGIRPDGVLAQIQRLNSQRRGGEVVAAAAAGPSALSSVVSNVKASAGSLLEQLKITKKG